MRNCPEMSLCLAPNHLGISYSYFHLESQSWKPHTHVLYSKISVESFAIDTHLFTHYSPPPLLPEASTHSLFKMTLNLLPPLI